ncbi:uncharacterized protein [Haliotis asinina]|uniref:uncharacterized protein n=1 Tax=Haliotis asinina TaxID=109174 RepID=UPI003531F2D4
MYASGGLASSVQTAKRDIGDILQSGKYYCNEEIARELTAVSNGLNHLNLDDKFLSTSKEWQGRKGPMASTAAPDAASVVGRLSGVLQNYKHQMEGSRITEKQENEIREMHQWAVTNLRNSQKDMMPYTLAATDRIRQFGDHIGVTDRFTGYRNNLTRTAREPDPTMWANRPAGLSRSHTTIGAPSMEQKLRMGEQTAQPYGVMGKKVTFGSEWPASYTVRGYRTIDSLYPRSTTNTIKGNLRPSTVMADVKSMNALNARLAETGFPSPRAQSATLMSKPPSTMSVQEQAGINTQFPGRTEYVSQYTRPPMDLPTSHFTINPKPDLSIYGRPLGVKQYYPSSTEYQTRYMWPDGSRIVKFPWLRK